MKDHIADTSMESVIGGSYRACNSEFNRLLEQDICPGCGGTRFHKIAGPIGMFTSMKKCLGCQVEFWGMDNGAWYHKIGC